MPEYGSVEWFERQYRRTASDPWGLSWRPTQMYRYAYMIDEVCRLLQARGAVAESVLDIGCATGDFTNLLRRMLPASAQRRVVGADLAATAVERARRRYPDLEFRTGGIDEQAAAFAGEMDLLTCLEVLYYVPLEQRDAALESLGSMLRPGGLLLVSTMIGKEPYIDHERLRALVETRFQIVGSGALTLWPLVNIEKSVLNLARFARAGSIDRYLPGRRGFRAMRALAGACGSLFGERARSHAYVLAVRR